jgi:hypothetical protein
MVLSLDQYRIKVILGVHFSLARSPTNNGSFTAKTSQPSIEMNPMFLIVTHHCASTWCDIREDNILSCARHDTCCCCRLATAVSLSFYCSFLFYVALHSWLSSNMYGDMFEPLRWAMGRAYHGVRVEGRSSCLLFIVFAGLLTPLSFFSSHSFLSFQSPCFERENEWMHAFTPLHPSPRYGMACDIMHSRQKSNRQNKTVDAIHFFVL